MPTNLTEVDEYTPNVAVPNPGEDRTSESIRPGFQSLANRSLNAKNRIATLEGSVGRLGAANAWTGANSFSQPVVLVGTELNYSAPVAVSVQLPLRSQIKVGHGSHAVFGCWLLASDATYVQSDCADDWYEQPIALPNGATLTGVIASVTPGGPGYTSNMQLDVRKVQNGLPLGTPSSVPIHAAGAEDVDFNMIATATPGNAELLGIGPVAELINNALYSYHVRVKSTDRSGGYGLDKLGGITISYTITRASGGR